MDQDELLSFGGYLANTKGLGERTVELYLYYYGSLDLDLLSNQEYVNAFVQSHKNNSVIRGMLLNALKFKGLHRKIDMPPTPTGAKMKRLIRSISKEEIDIMRRSLYKHSFKHGLVFDLIYQGALRRAEVPTIRISSFQWLSWFENTNKFCKLRVMGKGKKERTVLINPETAHAILDFFQKNKPDMDLLSFVNSDQILFSTQTGEPITEKMVYYVIQRGSKKYLGRNIRTHELRHQRATELQRSGVSLIDLRNYLGHSNLTTTEIYLHVNERESLDAIEKTILKN